jgi:uncharacterized protein (DUF983 family)
MAGLKTTFRVYLPKPPPPPPDDDGSFALLRGLPRGVPVWRVLTVRALCLRCPVCGLGRPFAGWLTMRRACPACHYHFEREEGYWLGSMTLNYAAVSAPVVLLFVLGTALWSWPIWLQVPLWIVTASLSVILLFPYTRLLWIAFDFLFLGPPRAADFEPGPEDPPDGPGSSRSGSG